MTKKHPKPLVVTGALHAIQWIWGPPNYPPKSLIWLRQLKRGAREARRTTAGPRRINPALLLDLSQPAFDFVTPERFNSCLYSSELLQPSINIIEQYRSEIISVLELLLPKLAEGWARQRGEFFGFGNGSKLDRGTSLTLFPLNWNVIYRAFYCRQSL